MPRSSPTSALPVASFAFAVAVSASSAAFDARSACSFALLAAAFASAVALAALFSAAFASAAASVAFFAASFAALVDLSAFAFAVLRSTTACWKTEKSLSDSAALPSTGSTSTKIRKFLLPDIAARLPFR